LQSGLKFRETKPFDRTKFGGRELLPPIEVEQPLVEKPDSENRDSDATPSSTKSGGCLRNPLLMASKSQVSYQFGKTIRNANVRISSSTIKNVKDTLG
jgi:hypothetical protein